MSNPTAINLESILTPEQISDIFIAYYRERKLAEAGNVHRGLVIALQPYMQGIDLVSGQQNDIDQLANIVEESFKSRTS